MSKKVSFFLTSIHHLLLRPRSFRSEFTRFVRSWSILPSPLKIKSKIHDEVSEASRQFPTTTSHSFQAAMFTRSIHPQNSGLSVSPRALSPSLFFSLQYPEPLSVPFNPLRQSVPGERLIHIFPRPNIHFLSFSTHDFRHDSYHSPRTRFKFKISSSSPFKKTRYRIEAKRDKIFVRVVFRVPFSRQRISPLNKIRAETVESRGTQGRLPFGKDFVGICRMRLSTRIER